MKLHRRKLLQGIAASGAAFALNAPAVLHAQAAPFKIGLLTVKTGPFA